MTGKPSGAGVGSSVAVGNGVEVGIFVGGIGVGVLVGGTGVGVGVA